MDGGFAGKAASRGEREKPRLAVLAALIWEPHGPRWRSWKSGTIRWPGARRTLCWTHEPPPISCAPCELRQQAVEPVVGIITEAVGFRRFSLCCHQKVSLDWDLVCRPCNFKRLPRCILRRDASRLGRGQIPRPALWSMPCSPPREPSPPRVTIGGGRGAAAPASRPSPCSALVRPVSRPIPRDPGPPLFPDPGGLLG